MEPYHPLVSASASSGLMILAYEGCKSSRRGGWTFTMGSSRRDAPAPLTGAFPLMSLIVAVVLCCSVVESRLLMIGRVEEVNDSAVMFVIVELCACDETIIVTGGLTSLICRVHSKQCRSGEASEPLRLPVSLGRGLGLCLESYTALKEGTAAD
jgi:hypothetical protein